MQEQTLTVRPRAEPVQQRCNLLQTARQQSCAANSSPATHQTLAQRGETGEDGHIHPADWTLGVAVIQKENQLVKYSARGVNVESAQHQPYVTYFGLVATPLRRIPVGPCAIRGFLFQAWGRSECSSACFRCCQKRFKLRKTSNIRPFHMTCKLLVYTLD